MVCFVPGDTDGEKRQHQGPATSSPEDSTGDMSGTHVYERRRLRKSVSLLPDNNAVVGEKRKFASDSVNNPNSVSLARDNNSGNVIPEVSLGSTISMQPHLQKPSGLASQPNESRNLVPISEQIKKKPLLEVPQNGGHKQALGSNIMDDNFSLSRSNVEEYSSVAKAAGIVPVTFSSSDVLPAEPSVQLPSARDLCSAVLGNCDQLGEDPPRSDSTTEDPPRNDSTTEDPPRNGSTTFDVFTFLRSCKVCGLKDDPLKLLICDLCDEAFHLTCYKVKKLTTDEWYCRLCLRERPNVLPETLSGQLFNTITERDVMRDLREKCGPILATLRYTGPYNSHVQVGKEYQAEVPEWTGPVSNDDDYFSKPFQFNPAASSYQRQEVIVSESDEDDEGLIWDKRRRALAKADDGSCSRIVALGPTHPDSAVPQGPTTGEEVERPEYVKKRRGRPAKPRGSKK